MKYRKSLSLERNVSRLCHTRKVHSSEPAKTLILVFSHPRLLPAKKKRNNRNDKSVHPLWRFLGGLTRGLQEPSVCCCCKCMHTIHRQQHHRDLKKYDKDAAKPVVRHIRLRNHSTHKITIYGLSLHQGNTESRSVSERQSQPSQNQ